MNLIEQIALHLQFCGLGAVSTKEAHGDIYWGRMPDEPDQCICVFSTDTGTPGANGNPARIQIMTRSKSTKWAYTKACEIAGEFDRFNGFLAGDGPQVITDVINSGAGLGADAKKRELYSTNIYCRYCG